MKIYTYSEARQNFAAVLDVAQREGGVRVTRRDGSAFTIQPLKEARSPLSVKGVKLKINRAEIVSAVREGRERSK